MKHQLYDSAHEIFSDLRPCQKCSCKNVLLMQTALSKRYQCICSKCGEMGPLSIFKEEAIDYWEGTC